MTQCVGQESDKVWFLGLSGSNEAGLGTSRNKSNPANLRWRGGFAQGQNRTADTGIFSPLLYRLSYLGPSDLAIEE